MLEQSLHRCEIDKLNSRYFCHTRAKLESFVIQTVFGREYENSGHGIVLKTIEHDYDSYMARVDST